MFEQLTFFADIGQFLHSGSDVLWLILIITIYLWYLIIDRLIFFKHNYPELKKSCLNHWEQRDDKKSADALSIRQILISEVLIQMSDGVSTIKVLIALCPLLGLLGTVTGMIHVFDVLAVTGVGNARAMANGVSQATIPTMAGMVIAISGLYFSKFIEEYINDESYRLASLLKYH